MNAHRLGGGQKLHGEAVLHQRLASAEREAAGHDLETVTYIFLSSSVAFATLTGRPLVMVQVSGL